MKEIDFTKIQIVGSFEQGTVDEDTLGLLMAGGGAK